MHPHELVVAKDGSIPTDQLAALGPRPGALHVLASPSAVIRAGIAGALTDFPDITLEDFVEASALATRDHSGR